MHRMEHMDRNQGQRSNGIQVQPMHVDERVAIDLEEMLNDYFERQLLDGFRSLLFFTPQLATRDAFWLNPDWALRSLYEDALKQEYPEAFIRLLLQEGSDPTFLGDAENDSGYRLAIMDLNYSKCCPQLGALAGLDSSSSRPLVFCKDPSLFASLLALPGAPINHKYPPEMMDMNGWDIAAIHAAVSQPSMLEKLLAHPCINVNTQTMMGISPLKRAVIHRCKYNDEMHLKSTELLLQHPDTDVNLPDRDGETPLMDACSYGCSDVVQLLVNHPSIDRTFRNTRGDSALTIAVRQGCESRVSKSIFAGIERLLCG